MHFELGGSVPVQVREPGSVDEVRDLVADARTAGHGLVPWGGGTAVGTGNPIARPWAAVLSSRLAGIRPDYSPADLVVTAGAGTLLADLQAFLASHGQRLPLEAPPGATLGGAVAANTAGKRRLSRGTVRDWLVGLEAVAGTGKAIRAGGRVVKNVTGYDFCKLFTGSRGTLGMLTELSFKVEPLPETAICGTVACPGFAEAEAVRRAAMEAGAAWLELRAGGAVGAGAESGREVGVTIGIEIEIGFEGFAADVEAQTGRVSAALRRECLDPPRWRPEEAPGSADPIAASPVLVRIGVLPDHLAPLLARGPAARVSAHLGSGIATIADIGAEIAIWRRLAAEAGGWAVLDRGPRDGADVFGPPRPEWSLGFGIKRALDPDSVWSPGRGPGGI